MPNTVADPVRLDMPYPQQLSRSELFVKWLFATMLYFEVWLWYRRWSDLYTFLAFWAILFTGRYPRSLFDFVNTVMAREFKVYCYYPLLLTDHDEPDQSHPLRFGVDYPQSVSRIAALLQFVSWPLLAVGICTATLVLFLTAIPTWWILLFTAEYPKSIVDFNLNALRWIARATAWKNHMRDDFPLLRGARSV